MGENFDKDKVIFYTKEYVSDFKNFIENANEDRIIIIKNIELFEESIFDLLSTRNKIIISGDLSKCSFKNKILVLTALNY